MIARGDCILEKCKVIGIKRKERKYEERKEKRDCSESFDGPCCCCRVVFLFEPRHCKLCLLRFGYREDINAPITFMNASDPTYRTRWKKKGV